MKEQRRTIKKQVVSLMVIVFIISIAVNANSVPDIGGTPIHTQTDYFSGDQTDWSLTVYSYVFDTTSSPPHNLALDSVEMLFMYLLDSDEAAGLSVDYFSVGNLHLLPINTVAYEDNILPSGYDFDDFQSPYTYGYAGPSQATTYNYSGDFLNPLCTLDPGEYSLVYYITIASSFAQVPATASGGGVSANGFVPGPIPEPATVLLLGLGALVLIRRRKT